MERTKYFLTTILVLLVSILFAENNIDIYKAYVSGNMKRWKAVIDLMEKQSIETNKAKLDLLNYQYGYVAYCISNDKDDEAKKYMQKADELIEQLEKVEYNLPLIYAYKAAFVGFEIGISPLKAPFIGPKSSNYARKSTNLDTNNFFGYVQLGNIAYHKPAIFGGSKEEAIEHYLQALKLMEKDKSKLKNNWNYLNLLVAIINTYVSQEKYELAKQYCIKTLTFEPQFKWVKNKLYPEVIEKLKNE